MAKDKSNKGGAAAGDATKTPKKNANLGTDVLTTLMPRIAKWGAQMIVDLVPEGSTLDQILDNSKGYLEEISDGLIIVIKRVTNLPDIADDIMSDIQFEIIEELKKRYNGEENNGKNSKSAAGTPSIGDIVGIMPANEYKKLMTLISGKDKSSLDKFFRHCFGLKQDKAVQALINLAQADQTAFDIWFDSRFPAKPPKQPLELGKKVSKAWNDFTNNKVVKDAVETTKKASNAVSTEAKEVMNSYNNSLAKPTLLEKIGKKLDIFGITK